MSARTRSEDEETVHYSMSEGEEGDLPAPTLLTPAPEGTPAERSRPWKKKRKRRRKKKSTGAGAGGGHPPPPRPPSAAGGSSGATGSRLETIRFIKQFTYIHFLLQIHLYLLQKCDNLTVYIIQYLLFIYILHYYFLLFPIIKCIEVKNLINRAWHYTIL